MRAVLIFICVANMCFSVVAQTRSDAILGRWRSDKGNLILQVYKINNEYRAKAVYHSGPISTDDWKDDKNPDPVLRNRKLIGTDMVTQLHYDPDADQWVDGIIYDATSGKSWEAVAWLDDLNTLKVKGYWLIRALNKVKTFTRVE